MLKKLLLAGASVLLTVLLVEVGFRIAGYRPIYDIYSRPEAFWKRDPTLGWTLRPGSQGTFVGPRPFRILYRTPIRINSLGLRGPEVGEIPSGGRRVLFLGDSQTAAFEVPEKATFVNLVGEEVSRRRGFPVQAINGGVRGYGTDQTYLLWRDHLRALRPDVVVYDKVINDVEDNITLHRPKRPFGKAAFGIDGSGTLHLKGAPIPTYPFCSSVRLDGQFRIRRYDGFRTRALCWLETNLSDHFASFSFLTTRLRQNPELIRRLWNAGQADADAPTSPPLAPSGSPAPQGPPPDTPMPAGRPKHEQDPAHRLTSALIEQLAREVQESGAHFVMVASDPDLAELDVGAFQASGIHILRTDPVLGGDQRAYRIPNDGHLNPEGHRKMAELIGPAVESLLPS
ncbi:MAG: hypothetical protein M3164_07990 [Actinomycetota bacterium]|nr:hypothetical protein [Actinomycetota bacterium]